MTEDKTSGDLVSLIEQVSGIANQIAMVEGGYFRELLSNGVPYDLACDLVRDWHNMYWQKQFYPDEEHG